MSNNQHLGFQIPLNVWEHARGWSHMSPCSPTQPHIQKGPMPGFMFCCHCLETLFLNKKPCISFDIGSCKLCYRF